MLNDIQTRTDVHQGMLMRKRLIRQLYDDISERMYRPKNWRVISHASGIPEETLREYYKILQDWGLVDEDGNSVQVNISLVNMIFDNWFQVERESLFIELASFEEKQEELYWDNKMHKENVFTCAMTIFHRAKREQNVSQEYMSTTLGWTRNIMSEAHRLLIRLKIISPNQIVVQENEKDVRKALRTELKLFGR